MNVHQHSKRAMNAQANKVHHVESTISRSVYDDTASKRCANAFAHTCLQEVEAVRKAILQMEPMLLQAPLTPAFANKVSMATLDTNGDGKVRMMPK